MKKNKRITALLLAAVLAAVTLTAGITVYAAPVAINATNFPDENFRSYVKNMKGVWNGQLTTELMADYLKIQSMLMERK